MEEFDKKISEIVRKTVKEFMESLMKGELQAFLEDHNASRNGYHDYPESIRRSIHSTNLIERMNKEIRRRIKIIDSMPSEESAMKIIYLRAAEINDKWSMRSLRGYYKCIDEIREMFQDRYPS